MPGLGIVISVIILAGAWLARRLAPCLRGVTAGSLRFTGRKAVMPIEVVGRVHLSTQHSVHLVQTCQRILIVGVGGASMTLLESLPCSEPQAPTLSPERKGGLQ